MQRFNKYLWQGLIHYTCNDIMLGGSRLYYIFQTSFHFRPQMTGCQNINLFFKLGVMGEIKPQTCSIQGKYANHYMAEEAQRQSIL